MNDNPSEFEMDSPGVVAIDEMMNDYQGRPVARIVLFTIIVHVAFIGGLSIGYIKDLVLGENTTELTPDQRLDNAVRESTIALRAIAEKHHVRVQELSERFASGGSTPAAAAPAPAGDGDSPAPADGATPEDGANPAGDNPTDDGNKSDIERTLEKATPGPAMPDLSADEEDSLFPPKPAE